MWFKYSLPFHIAIIELESKINTNNSRRPHVILDHENSYDHDTEIISSPIFDASRTSGETKTGRKLA